MAEAKKFQKCRLYPPTSPYFGAKPPLGPKICCQKIRVYYIQNDHTEHINGTKKTEILKNVIGPKNVEKLSKFGHFGHTFINFSAH